MNAKKKNHILLILTLVVVELLKTLFVSLQCTTEKAISPEYDLAYMALLNEKDQQQQEEDTTTLRDPEEMEYEVGDNSSISSNTPADAPPAYEEVMKKEQEQIEEVEKLPNKPKERPSVDAMMFGKQQDVTGENWKYM